MPSTTPISPRVTSEPPPFLPFRSPPEPPEPPPEPPPPPPLPLPFPCPSQSTTKTRLRKRMQQARRRRMKAPVGQRRSARHGRQAGALSGDKRVHIPDILPPHRPTCANP